VIGEPRFIHERLGPHHDRVSFLCRREPVLSAYLIDPARGLRGNSHNISAVYCLLDTAADRKIAGFFTVSNATVIPTSVPPNISKRLPRYDSWGCVKLGRMARHDDYAGEGVGPILVARALAVALSIAESSGSFAMLVDAKNERLAAWCEGLGFQRLLDRPLALFITNATMAAYLERLKNLGA
jgi:GNAT superfamily N-acetyltransferase